MAIEFATARGVLRLEVAAIPVEEDRAPTLLDAVRARGLPLGQSCRGEGVCRSCVLRVERGAAALPPLTAIEARFGFSLEHRLACQVELSPGQADLRVHSPAWGSPPAPGEDPGATLR